MLLTLNRPILKLISWLRILLTYSRVDVTKSIIFWRLHSKLIAIAVLGRSNKLQFILNQEQELVESPKMATFKPMFQRVSLDWDEPSHCAER